jgi:hypothetical protein
VLVSEERKAWYDTTRTQVISSQHNPILENKTKDRSTGNQRLLGMPYHSTGHDCLVPTRTAGCIIEAMIVPYNPGTGRGWLVSAWCGGGVGVESLMWGEGLSPCSWVLRVFRNEG